MKSVLLTAIGKLFSLLWSKAAAAAARGKKGILVRWFMRWVRAHIGLATAS